MRSWSVIKYVKKINSYVDKLKIKNLLKNRQKIIVFSGGGSKKNKKSEFFVGGGINFLKFFENSIMFVIFLFDTPWLHKHFFFIRLLKVLNYF